MDRRRCSTSAQGRLKVFRRWWANNTIRFPITGLTKESWLTLEVIYGQLNNACTGSQLSRRSSRHNEFSLVRGHRAPQSYSAVLIRARRKVTLSFRAVSFRSCVSHKSGRWTRARMRDSGAAKSRSRNWPAPNSRSSRVSPLFRGKQSTKCVCARASSCRLSRRDVSHTFAFNVAYPAAFALSTVC